MRTPGGTRSAALEGVTLHWREAGAGDDAVLFLHGFPFDSELWDGALAALPDGWRGIAPDLRGFGASEPGDQPIYTMQRFARDALALLDHLEIRRAAVCGLSMGGYIAFQLWRAAPERVRALVLCDTRTAADSPEASAGRRALAARARAEGTAFLPDDLVSKLLAPATLRQRPDVADRLRAMIARQPAESVARASLGMAQRTDAGFIAASIPVPTLVLVGAEDAVTPVHEAERMCQAMPHAHLRVIPGAGHLPPLETPAAFEDALAAFLAAQRDASA